MLRPSNCCHRVAHWRMTVSNFSYDHTRHPANSLSARRVAFCSPILVVLNKLVLMTQTPAQWEAKRNGAVTQSAEVFAVIGRHVEAFSAFVLVLKN